MRTLAELLQKTSESGETKIFVLSQAFLLKL